jgi:hypothetical protein
MRKVAYPRNRVGHNLELFDIVIDSSKNELQMSSKNYEVIKSWSIPHASF